MNDVILNILKNIHELFSINHKQFLIDFDRRYAV